MLRIKVALRAAWDILRWMNADCKENRVVIKTNTGCIMWEWDENGVARSQEYGTDPLADTSEFEWWAL